VVRSGCPVSRGLVYPSFTPWPWATWASRHVPPAQRPPRFVCERAFLPARRRPTNTPHPHPILTLESQRPLTDFAAVAFSISFEATTLRPGYSGRAGIPLRRGARPGTPWSWRRVATFLNPSRCLLRGRLFLGEGEAAHTVLRVPGRERSGPDRAALLQDLARSLPALRARRLYTQLPPGRHPGGLDASRDFRTG